MAKNEVVETDTGYKKFLGDVESMNGAYTTIGVQDDGESTDEGYSMAELAAVLNYGTKDGHIPPRPAQQQAFDNNVEEIKELQKRLLNGVITGKLELEQALNILGQAHTKHVQEAITQFSDPENADLTVELKGFDNPLIHTGRYKNSIRHEVKVK